jgi:hypothetical protein
MVVALLFNGVNTYAHVVAFPHSPKSRALEFVQYELRRNPGARIGMIAYPGRSPFASEGLADHLDVFSTMIPPGDEAITTWAQYLESIGHFLSMKHPRYVLCESIIFGWTVFLPRHDASDFGNRLKYPNPGYDAWCRMLRQHGYSSVQVLTEGQGEKQLQRLLGRAYLTTCEGTTGAVHIFERVEAGLPIHELASGPQRDAIVGP